jgi:hypothetical protein
VNARADRGLRHDLDARPRDHDQLIAPSRQDDFELVHAHVHRPVVREGLPRLELLGPEIVGPLEVGLVGLRQQEPVDERLHRRRERLTRDRPAGSDAPPVSTDRVTVAEEVDTAVGTVGAALPPSPRFDTISPDGGGHGGDEAADGGDPRRVLPDGLLGSGFWASWPAAPRPIASRTTVDGAL